ncbi:MULTISPECIES: transposase family protein [Streptomyces]|uniref:Transposase family protein n=2 Tax=Streptomyces TaxID=1883 RepID=A0ABV9J7T5_9ACTN
MSLEIGRREWSRRRRPRDRGHLRRAGARTLREAGRHTYADESFRPSSARRIRRPRPGRLQETSRCSGLTKLRSAQHCEDITGLGDGAYVNTSICAPHRRRPGRPLPAGEEAGSTAHRQIRAWVEHAFARVRNFKILRGCRRSGGGLHRTVHAVARMRSLTLAA